MLWVFTITNASNLAGTEKVDDKDNGDQDELQSQSTGGKPTWKKRVVCKMGSHQVWRDLKEEADKRYCLDENSKYFGITCMICNKQLHSKKTTETNTQMNQNNPIHICPQSYFQCTFFLCHSCYVIKLCESSK